MPIPKPKKNERKNEFINRCMTDSVMTNEYRIAGQRFAVCNLSFEETRREEYKAMKEKKGSDSTIANNAQVENDNCVKTVK